MTTLTTVIEMRQACRDLRQRSAAARPSAQSTLGFVPTMGALHAGHRSLLRAARDDCDAVVASIFVNPLQFAAGEDYDRYPRTFEDDCRLLELAGVDLLFAPSVDEMYPEGASTFVEVRGIGDRLDGLSRPGHFRGVATVVAKLFGIVNPDRAFFGQKDAAQLAVLRAMVRDLCLPLQLIACPTVREPDGLAISSRNRYLSPEERARAVLLPRALEAGQRLLQQGEFDAQRVENAITNVLASDPQSRIDYVAVVDPETLLPVEGVSSGALVAIAVWVGRTRLIDNFAVQATLLRDDRAVRCD